MIRRIGVMLRAVLACALIASVVVLPPAAAAVPAAVWSVEWNRDVSEDVGTPKHVAVDVDGSYYVVGDTLAKYAADGELLWRIAPGDYWEGTTPESVTCEGDYVYLTLAAGWVVKISASDGEYQWDARILSWSGWMSAVPKVEVHDGVLHVQSIDATSIVQMDSENGDYLGAVPISDGWSWFEMGGIEVDDDAFYLSLDDDGDCSVQAFGRFGVNDSIWYSDLDDYGDPALAPENAALYVPYSVWSHWDEGLGESVHDARIAAFNPADGTVIDDFVLPDPYSNRPAGSLDCDSAGAIYAAIPDTNEVIKLSPQEPIVTRTIDNGIIKMTVTPTGLPAAYVWDGSEWVYQYYSEDAWGTILWLDGEDYTNGYRGATDFTPVSNEIELLAGGKQIVTVYDAGNTGVRVTQTFTIMDGDRYLTKDWKIEHLGGDTVASARLYHGGDTFFGGEDSASSYYDTPKSMVYVRNNEFADWGIMGFYANPATPADHYFGGHYSTGNDYAEENQDLPDTADEDFQDAGYYLQWNKFGPLVPGDPAWHIQAYEVWTPGGALQVLAPGSQNVLPGSTVVLPFTLHNISEVPQDVTLSVESDDPAWGVEIIGGTAPDVGATERIPVQVRVTVPADATEFANITLRAEGPETQGAGTTRLNIGNIDFTVDPPAAELRTRPGEWAQQDITITNNSDQPMKLGAIAFSDPDHFGNGEGEGNYSDIGPGDSMTFPAFFGADAFGEYPCTVSIPIASPLLVTATVQLTGIIVPDVTLTYLAGPGGSIEGSATQVIGQGSDGTAVTAIPDADYRFVTWSDGVDTPERQDAAVSDDMTVTATFEYDPAAVEPVEVAGASRYATAIEASKDAFPEGAPAVVVATGAEFPDALGGSALAGALDSPILLTTPGALLPEVAAEIDRLGAEKAYVLGGAEALAPAVFDQLGAVLGAGNVQRIGGSDRYQTARLVAAEAVRLLGDDFDGVAFVATGAEFADALAASPLAAANGWPVYLAPSPVIAPETIAAMQAANVTQIYLLGGEAAMPHGTEVSILEAGFIVTRIDGVDRYDTAARVAAFGVDGAGMQWDGVALATGEDFADALAGGPAQGAHGAVMLLTRAADLPEASEDALIAHRDDISVVRFLGGQSAIFNEVRDHVSELLTD